MEKCTPTGEVHIHKHVFFVTSCFDESVRGNLQLFQCLGICHNDQVPKI